MFNHTQASFISPGARARALILALAAALLVFARPAFAETFFGFLYAGEPGYMLEDYGGNLYLLDGKGLDGFLDTDVVIEGEMFLDEGGEPVIRVFDIKEDTRILIPEDNVVSMNLNYHGQ